MKTVIVIGEGVRASGADPTKLLFLGVPILSSWQAADLIDNRHPMYFGRPGIYGQRCANQVLYAADRVLAIGCRLSPWLIGHAGLRQEQKLSLVDIDTTEAARFPEAEWLRVDANDYIESIKTGDISVDDDWLAQCNAWREQYPWIESPAHDNTGFINSYRFVEYLENLLEPDAIVVTDAGSMMCPVFQGLHVKPPQRLMTSGCLGEMGCGLPAAIGASFATGRGNVVCILGDGSMNKEELQTIRSHSLPIKVIVFENDGYGMIKGTHKNMKIPYAGVNRGSGLWIADACRLSDACDIGWMDVKTWDRLEKLLPGFLQSDGPALMQIHIDPEQAYVPRLQPIIKDGKITPAQFNQMSPIHA